MIIELLSPGGTGYFLVAASCLVLGVLLESKGINQWVHDEWPTYALLGGMIFGYGTGLLITAWFTSASWFMGLYPLLMAIGGTVMFLSSTLYVG